MKKHFFIFWVLVSFLAVTINAQSVYVTKTGEKYHNGTCRYLSKSKIAIELTDALAQGYEACKICRPTQTVKSTSKKEVIEDNPELKQQTKTTEAAQCSASTQKGSRCKRITKSTNGKCWQHGG